MRVCPVDFYRCYNLCCSIGVVNREACAGAAGKERRAAVAIVTGMFVIAGMFGDSAAIVHAVLVRAAGAYRKQDNT